MFSLNINKRKPACRPARIRHLAGCLVLTAVATLGLSSCDLMHDDLPECAVAPSVHTCVDFIYDYNVDKSDRFAQEVGSVTLYVYDNAGRFVSRHERTNAADGDALKQPGFRIDLDLAPGTYKVYAIAQANPDGYQASLQTPGAVIRRNEPAEGSSVDDFRLAIPNTNGLVDNQNVSMETVWATLQPQELVVPQVSNPKEGDPQQDDIEVHATIPLLRLTNNVHLTFFQADMPTNIEASNYEVWVDTSLPHEFFSFTGNYLTTGNKLHFSPYRTGMTTDELEHSAVELDMSLPRFMQEAHVADCTTLHIRNKVSGYENKWDLTALLANLNQAYASEGWTAQEFLDRECDYELSVALDGNSWKYIDLKVSILSWSKRIQNEEL